MNALLATAPIPPSFWNAPHGSGKLYGLIALMLVLGTALVIGLMNTPSRARRPIVISITFLGGLFYVLNWLIPTPINRESDELPMPGTLEPVGFWFQDALPIVGNIANVMTAILLGLGIYSLLRIHVRRFLKQQKDWPFSLALMLSMVAMLFFGLYDWSVRKDPTLGAELEDPAKWTWIQYGKDLLFDGLLQQMDSVMFSMIAFFILSAAYRAFRIRSVESTILLGTALVVILSLMGAVSSASDQLINSLSGGNADSLWNAVSLGSIADWLKNVVQTSSLRAIDFGIGVGSLAMSLRIWLSLERGGMTG